MPEAGIRRNGGVCTPPVVAVAVGASRGGLSVLSQLFGRLPRDSGAAYVVLQHLSSSEEMDTPLRGETNLPVQQATNDLPVEANHVYLIPPDRDMIISEGRLLLSEKDAAHNLALPIDRFLRSLAVECEHCAVAIILSGTGTDGSRGIEDVAAAGGLVICQNPEEAEFDGMPGTAITTGVVDLILDVAAIPGALAQHLANLPILEPEDNGSLPGDNRIRGILDHLRHRHGIDFADHKPSTLVRRIARRAALLNCADFEEYSTILANDDAESIALHDDLLIGVTGFFRDEEAFDELETRLRQAFTERGTGEFRVWIAGCATGEEAYSVAMLLDETRTDTGWPGKVQIFATDVHREAVRAAAEGIYSGKALMRLGGPRRERYFLPEGGNYRVAERLRDMLVFAQHDLVADAPFVQLDLVCCRNVLVYLLPKVQDKVLSLFHFGLKAGGILFLGSSESPGHLADEFRSLRGTGTLYTKIRDIQLLDPSLTATSKLGRPAAPRDRIRRPPARDPMAVYDAVLARYMPPAFLLDGDANLVHCFNGAEQFLALRAGRVSTQILDLLSGRLRNAVSGLIEQARANRNAAPSPVDIEVGQAARRERLRINVVPVPVRGADEIHYLFELLPRSNAETAAAENDDAIDYVTSLERELESMRGNLRGTVDDLEAANAALQVANEELVTSNEELQSTNEELRSVNEELHIVNSEHQRKIEELFEVTEDLENLLNGTEVGVLFLDRDMNIRRATENVRTLLCILPQDVGRSFAHFARNLDAPGILDDVREVLSTREKKQQELTTKEGRTILMSILPYRTEGTAGGVVVTFVDVSRLAGALAEADRLSAIVQSARAAIVSKDLDGNVLSWNDGAAALYGYESEEVIGKNIRVIFPPERSDELQTILAQIRAGKHVAPYSTRRVRKSGDEVDVMLSVSPVKSHSGEIVGASAIAWDVSDTKLANERALLAVAQRDKFLAVLSHELRNPMMALSNANEVLQNAPGDDVAARARQIVARQVAQMSRILEEILDTSRLRQDNIELNRHLIDLRVVLRRALDALRAEAQKKGIDIAVLMPEEAVCVKADHARLQQAVVNLGLNAITHSSAQSRIQLEIEARPENAVVRVKDTGSGISAKDLPNVFEPFFRGEEKQGSGRGLALALAQAVAKAHGGYIAAFSDGEGTGTEFELALPIVDALETTSAELRRPDFAGTDGRATVLLIDDDDDARETLALLLRSSNYDVLEAADGTSGIETILATKPSVAIVDIGLPDISGLDVARKIREDVGPHVVRLIALTGYGQQTDRETAIEAGFDMHLVKPLAFETLEKVIAYQASR
jgi:two-component system CheB/CheR fusion protein